MSTREEKLKKIVGGYKKQTGIKSEDERAEESGEEPGIFSRLGATLMDTLGEKKPVKGKEDPRLKRQQESIRKEIPIEQSSIETKDGPGEEGRGKRVRKLLMGLKRPESA